MTHAERLRNLAHEYKMSENAEARYSEECEDAATQTSHIDAAKYFQAHKEALLAGAVALDRLANLPHYDDCDKWAKADAPDGCDVIIEETRECTCALGSTRGHRTPETGQGGTNATERYRC